MKDNEIAKIVNQLTAVAKEYVGTDQLRAAIREVIVPVLQQDTIVNTIPKIGTNDMKSLVNDVQEFSDTYKKVTGFEKKSR